MNIKQNTQKSTYKHILLISTFHCRKPMKKRKFWKKAEGGRQTTLPIEEQRLEFWQMFHQKSCKKKMEWNILLKIFLLKISARILYSEEFLFRSERKIFLEKHKLRKCITSPCRKCQMTFSGRRKMMWVKNVDLHLKRKSIIEEINEGKGKKFFLINWCKTQLFMWSSKSNNVLDDYNKW